MRARTDRTGPNWTEDGDFIVGHGRPPEHSRWQPGQSGNPRGPKPKPKLSPEAAFEQEVLKPFKIRMNGEEATMDMGTFSISLLKKAAAGGSIKSAQVLLQLHQTILRKQVEADDTPETEAWEQQVIDALLADYGLPAKPVVRKARDTGDAGDAGEPA